ncbi:hypothetical protein KW794_01240 [Candidatus Saccharibacteria bacterium]|nr:hypothetical protein [Candidatus Saccharibacteria bacterium]
MSFEELGISQKDQLEMKARAVHGAIHDAISRILPIANELRSEKGRQDIEDRIARIMEEQDVAEEEAEIILAEQILLERNKGE